MPIVKNKTYKKPKFGYLLRYMCESEDRLFDAQGKSFTITHNIRGNSIAAWVKQFEENETHRLRKRKNSVYVNHDIISFHREDTASLSMEKLQLLVRQYIQLRNPNGCYVAVPHFDRYHVHVHICSSAIEYRTGKSMRMSRADFALLKKDLQNYQVKQFPELSRSVVRHGSKTKGASEKEMQYTLRTGKVSKREMVRQSVHECQRRAANEEEFYELLRKQGMETYERGGKVYGVVWEGRKWRFGTIGIDISVSKGKKRGLDQWRNPTVYLRE